MPNTGGTGRLVIYCDGGARGNPGPAAFGYVILDDGREVDARGEFLGETTNNVAEYRGLIAAARRRREVVMTARGRAGRWLKLLAPGLVDRIASRSVSFSGGD